MLSPAYRGVDGVPSISWRRGRDTRVGLVSTTYGFEVGVLCIVKDTSPVMCQCRFHIDETQRADKCRLYRSAQCRMVSRCFRDSENQSVTAYMSMKRDLFVKF